MVGHLVDELEDVLSFDFGISIPQLDLLLTIARRGPGYLGENLPVRARAGASQFWYARTSRERCANTSTASITASPSTSRSTGRYLR